MGGISSAYSFASGPFKSYFMGKQVGPPYITGRVGDLCYYKLNGQYYVRKQSSLTRKRVKRGRAFQRTMQYAAWLARASKIAAGVYRLMPRETRQVSKYRAMTGEGIVLLKAGIAVSEIQARLMAVYLSGGQAAK